MTQPVWTTSNPDWERKIVNQESLLPCGPLFPEEADAALSVMKELRIVDVPNSPRIGECTAPWILDFASVFFGSLDPDSGKRLIQDFFLLVSKKNSKALALDTKIPTPDGWKIMGDLEVGDFVFGTDGRPCRVTATSPVYENHKCYELHFSNGQKVIADAGHLWFTNALQDRPGIGQGNRGKLKNIRNRVRTTEEIANTLLRPGDGARNHSMPMPEPILCTRKDLPIAPYTLGAWLGDGTSGNSNITTMDMEILEAIKKEGYRVDYLRNNGSKASTYVVGKRDRRFCRRGHELNEANANRNEVYPKCRICEREVNKAKRKGLELPAYSEFSLYEVLMQNNLINNKHIPDIYLRASFDQRLALLQGLMDTDGTVNKSGKVFSYTTIRKELADGVSELLSTFGIKHSVIENTMTCNGVELDGRTCFNIQFSTFRDQIPCFKLTRKLERMRFSNPKKVARSRNVHFTYAAETSSVPVKCISVSSPDKQFLFGETMLPTHNSTIAAGIMLTVLIRNWRKSAEFIILAPTIEVANNAYAPARDMVKHDPELSALLHVQDHIRTITHAKTGATLKVVAAETNTVGGKKAAGILVDELWIMGKNPHADNMLREATGGLASKPEGFVIYLSTQSDQPPAGVFKNKLNYAREVRDGNIEDNGFLPVLYEFPKSYLATKKNREVENFYITNPNLGYSVSEDFLKREYKKAEQDGEESLLSFLSKHTNLEIGMALRSDRWAGADFWQECGDTSITLDCIIERSDAIAIGIDGGGLDDLLGFGVLGRCKQTKNWLFWSHAWAHPSVLERRKQEAERFKDFEKDGKLTLVEKMGDDVAEIADLVSYIDSTDLLFKVGVDPIGISAIAEAIIAEGVPEDKIIGISQGYKLGSAIKTCERKLVEKTLLHDGSAMMAWCVSNCKIEPRANGALITKQASGSAKIDPVIALLNAAMVMNLNPPAQTERFKMFFVG